MTTILRPVNRWYCPACRKEDVTHEARPHSRFHACPKTRGLTTPMLPAGTKAKIELLEPQDYIGRELVQRDPERNRPVQSLVVTRDEGQDAVVYAPTATMGGGAH